MFSTSIQDIDSTVTYTIEVTCEDCGGLVSRIQGCTYDLDNGDDYSVLTQIEEHSWSEGEQEQLAATLSDLGEVVLDSEYDYNEYGISYNEDDPLPTALCKSCLEERQSSFNGDGDGEGREVDSGLMGSITLGKHIF